MFLLTEKGIQALARNSSQVQKKIHGFVVVLICHLALQIPFIHSKDSSKDPFLLIGSIESEKNYTAAALLGVEFMWREYLGFVQIAKLIPAKGEETRIKKEFDQPLPRLGTHNPKKLQEQTILYQNESYPFPFYNVQGFTKKQEKTDKKLRQILKKKIKGFVLQVSCSHLYTRGKKSSLDVMDYILPYFEGPQPINYYLAPSVCLLITEFGGPLPIWDSVEKRKKRACDSLRKSMKTCYMNFFYKSSKGTKEHAILAKQKAFYDIFLNKPENIKPDQEKQFSLKDFDLNFKKIIFFDPKKSLDSLHVGDSGKVSTEKLYAIIKEFEGISPKDFRHSNKRRGLYLLPTISLLGALAGYTSYTFSKKGLRKKYKEQQSN